MERAGCTHVPEIHTSHSIHTPCMSTASRMPEQKMNLQKPAQPLGLLHQTRLPQTSSLPTRQLQNCCCKGKRCCLRLAPFSFAGRLTSSPTGRKKLRQRPVGATIVTSFHNLVRVVIQSATIPKEGTRDHKPILSSTQPSSQSTQLLGIHLRDVSEGHLSHYTDLFGYRNLPSAPVLYQPKSASTLTERRINITRPPALQRELPISNNLKMSLSS